MKKRFSQFPLVAGLAAMGILASMGWVSTAKESAEDSGRVIAPLESPAPNVEEAIQSANSLSVAFRTVADRLLPTVVAIENRPKMAWNSDKHVQPSQQRTPEMFRGGNPFEGTPFEDFFNEREFRSMPPGNRPRQQPRGGGIGSGVIIDPSGIVLTNNHVVAGGGTVTVRTHDGSEYEATEVWTDPKTDLAVVKISGATDLLAAPLGNSDDVAIGDWVIALGQPFGLESTVTAGIISAKNRGIGITARENFLQTDAAINPGNSGGPLVNLRGEVVGINTAISSRSGGNEGIGFAVPSNLAKWVSDQLVSEGAVRRAYLGVGIQPVTQAIGEQLNVKARSGVAVTEVFGGTPAADAGFEPGDVIVDFNGRSVRTPQQLQLAVERTSIGETVPVTIKRNGKTVELRFTAQEQPSQFGTRTGNARNDVPESLNNFGMEVAPLTKDVAEKLQLADAEGVVIVEVTAGSPADEAGLKSGMVITQVNRQAVTSVKEFVAAIESDSDGNGVLLLVRTDEGSRFVVLK